jgi:hypothetical protein
MGCGGGSLFAGVDTPASRAAMPGDWWWLMQVLFFPESPLKYCSILDGPHPQAYSSSATKRDKNREKALQKAFLLNGPAFARQKKI